MSEFVSVLVGLTVSVHLLSKAVCLSVSLFLWLSQPVSLIVCLNVLVSLSISFHVLTC